MTDPRAQQFKVRFPTFGEDLEEAKTICCFRKHSTGEPIYKNEESLWNRCNNEYRKLGFLHRPNMDEWVDFWYNKWEQFRQDHFDWLAKQGPMKNLYSTVKARDEAFGKALREAYEKYDPDWYEKFKMDRGKYDPYDPDYGSEEK